MGGTRSNFSVGCSLPPISLHRCPLWGRPCRSQSPCGARWVKVPRKPSQRERLRCYRERDEQCMTTAGRAYCCWSVPAGSQAWEQVWLSRPGKAQKLHAGHPYACPTYSVLRSTDPESIFILPVLGPKPPSQPWLLSLRLSICSDPPRCHRGTCRPCSHPYLPHPSSTARETFQKSSCHSSAPNPPRPSCRGRRVLKQCPCWDMKTWCHPTSH